jgi:tripartite-type tricarboxylate transporter receptor subunit TctC
MKLARRQFLHLAAGAAALPAVSRIANAQAYPTRPITVIVPYAAVHETGASPPDGLSLLRAGSIKAYAVTNATRLTVAPDIPTFGEMGLPTVSFSLWAGLFAPKSTPKSIIDKLNAAAIGALADPVVRSRLADLGHEEVVRRDQQTPEALGAVVKADADKWWPIIKELRIKAE